MPRLDIGSKATGLRDGGGQRLGRLVKRGKAVAPRGLEPPGLGHGIRPAGIAVSPPRGFGIAIRKRELLLLIGGVEAQESLRHARKVGRSEEHTSELQSLMRISYAVFCLKKITD